jgi:Mg2+ and Co2+ transporter CorA
MIKYACYVGPDGRLLEGLEAARIKDYLGAGDGLLWVDIEDATDKDGDLLSGVFRFHPLAVADFVSKDIHPPKIHDFDDYLFIILHGIN